MRDIFGRRLRFVVATLTMVCICAATLHAEDLNPRGTNAAGFGPFGPQSSRLREQLWVVPGADPQTPLRATVFQPPADDGSPARRPLVIINHGSDAATRESVSMPIFYWLSRWFVERGYVVVLPQRRGFGATGGEFAEANDTCLNPDHASAGLAAADDIEAVMNFMLAQPFVKPNSAVVVGISAGGWATLALASRHPAGMQRAIAFAPGRGGHAWGKAGEICGEEKLVSATADFGAGTQVPTLWLYSRNDTFFPPRVAQQLVNAWTKAGGDAEFHLLPAYNVEGHDIANDRAGWMLWGNILEQFLDTPPAERARMSASFIPSE